MLRSSFAVLGIALLTGCGDVSVVRLDVEFAEESLRDDTRALRVITRTLPDNPARACIDFETGEPPPGENLQSGVAVVRYPVADPIDLEFELGGSRPPSNIDVSLYSALTFIVLAHPSEDVEQSLPIAGDCESRNIDPEDRIEVPLILERID